MKLTSRVGGHSSFVVRIYGGGLLLVMCAATSAAQTGAGDASSRAVGRITGTVYDSLLQSPLAAATVWVRGGTRMAIADLNGRYVLDSVPEGGQFVAFAHPELDSLGLTTLGSPVTIKPGRATRLALGTPSLATFHRALCAGRAAFGSDSGIVLGHIDDAESGERLAGAVAVVEWSEVARDKRGKLQFSSRSLPSRCTHAP